MTIVRWCPVGAALLAVLACATSPARRLDAEAGRLGYRVLIVAGDGFAHRAYAKEGSGGAAGAPLHVYLEGDGRPFASATRVARDPHTRRPVAFELMGLDPAPALYLARPCYHRALATAPCTPALWTAARYGEAVVSSLAAALEQALGDRRRAVLIGYSGGGTLAWLLAERLPGRVTAVVTLAANLDVAGWARRHGYTPLEGSLDPARRPPLPATIRQLHVAAEGDANVPPSLIAPVVSAQPNATLAVVPGDHRCCWQLQWPALLLRLAE